MTHDGWDVTWRGRWIWAGKVPIVPEPLVPGAMPPPQTWNRFCYLRRTFTIPSAPASAPARVTADSRFVLYVNGAEVARGPARSTPPRWSWSELDLAPHLRAGENVVGAVVRFYGRPGPWWVPARPCGELGYGGFLFEAPTVDVVSDAGWRGRPGPYRQDVPVSGLLPHPAMEIVDGSDVPVGWTDPGFDDTSWDEATVLGGQVLLTRTEVPPCDPYAALESDDIPPLTQRLVAVTPIGPRRGPVRIGDDPLGAYPDVGRDEPDDGHVHHVFDAGTITLATPWVEVRGEPGTVVDLYTSEELRPDGLPEPSPRYWSMRYRIGGRDNERTEAFEATGFRYLAVAVRGEGRIESVGATERRAERAEGASFSCDDERLDAIWRTGVRTLELCATDAFIDCPGREQRAWVGDSYLTTLVWLVASSDPRLARRMLRICAQAQRSDGLLGMVACGDFGLRAATIPDFSAHWVRGLCRYHEYTGDDDTARELWPAAWRALDGLERYRGRDGLLHGVPSWVFVDWAMTERAEVTGVVDALYAAALTDAAELVDHIGGDPAAAAQLRSRAARTQDAFEALWDPRRGVYVDAADGSGPRRRVSQHTNVMAIVSGCAPSDRWEGILDAVCDQDRVVITPTMGDDMTPYVTGRLDPADYMAFDPERDVVGAQPFFTHFVHQALVRAGRADAIADACLRWEPQLASGNGTFEEYWSAPSGQASRCHVWSATPTYDLVTHTLGVRPLRPGFSHVEIKPAFGRLQRLSGRVPTPYGWIELDVTPSSGTVTVPTGVDARLEHPVHTAEHVEGTVTFGS